MLQTIENEYVRLSFSSDTGNLTEIKNKMTGDNYIKKVPDRPVFSIICMSGNSCVKRAFIPYGTACVDKIRSEKSERLEIRYSKLNNRDECLDMNAKITVELKDGCSICWYIEIENKDSGYDIVEVLFPHITGIYLGDSWSDDIIIYPHHAGEKTKNPVEEYTSERYLNFWRAYTKLENGIYSREINYCGLASMMWMYYYDSKNGFYISSNDGNFLVTGMRVETGGAGDPWMGFGIRKYSRINCGEKWKSDPYTMAVNCEDWHWGAKEYRKWIEPYLKFNNNPPYLKDEYVLNQCYNFKKDGKMMNRFEDIPRLHDKGMEYGARHMFIASWNRKGFDCNYPEYYPDMELGSSMDLYNGCSYVNENGGFVTFYINSRIFDVASDFYSTLGNTMAIKKEDGNIISEEYGPVKFAVMCPSDAGWQKHLIDTACWMVKSYAATGIYLDQLGSAEPFPCYDSRHSHGGTGEFNRGYLGILACLKEKLTSMNPNTFLMIENCGDIYGSYVWGNLTWNGDTYDEYFNVFKYTFPEYMQVNMVNPLMGEYGEIRMDKFYRSMERALLLGSVLWLGLTYKFEEADRELLDYARKAIAFRGKANIFIKNGIFIDNEDILYMSEGINCSHWITDDGKDLVMAGNKNMAAGCCIIMKRDNEPGRIICEDIDGRQTDAEFSFECSQITINLPQSRMCYLLM